MDKSEKNRRLENETKCSFLHHLNLFIVHTIIYIHTKSHLKIITRTRRNQITNYTLYIKHGKMCEKWIVSRENGVYFLYMI